jgi:tetratricopeptide (TPR) repeat protein
MTIHERIALIESEIDHDDVSSLVHGADRLRELLVATPPPDAVPVLLSLCPLVHDAGSYAELASCAAQIAASPHAGTRERLFGQYWAENARAHLTGDSPIPAYLDLLTAIGDDVSPELTHLGNRLWNPAFRAWRPRAFLDRYLPWAAPRFPSASDEDRGVIVARVLDRVDDLDDNAEQVAVAAALLSWPGLDDPHWRIGLRRCLAAGAAEQGDSALARSSYLQLADDAVAAGELAAAVSARVQAARTARDAGEPEVAIRELERIRDTAAPEGHDDRLAVANARLVLVDTLILYSPDRGASEGEAMWRDLGRSPSDEIAHLAGLALARSWNELAAEPRRERATRVLARFPSPSTPEIRTLMVMALNTRTRAVSELGDDRLALTDADAAHALCTPEVPDFVRATTERNRLALQLRTGDYSERDEIYGVVRALLDDADAASGRGDAAEGERLYRRAFDMARPSSDTATRIVGLLALQNWTVDLLSARDYRRAAEIARLSIESAIIDGGVGTELLAQAWLQFGNAVNRLADRAMARHAFRQVMTIAADAPSAAVEELGSQAAWNDAVLADDGSQPHEALAAYARVITPVTAASSLTQQRRAAKALKNTAVVFSNELNRPQDAAAAWAQLAERYANHPDAELARLVAEAQQHLPTPRGGFWRRR